MKTRIAILLLTLAAFSSYSQTCAPPLDIQVEILSSELVSDSTQYAQCHASTLVETNTGLLLAFFAGPYERHPAVGIYAAHFDGKRWSRPKKVADGFVNDTLSYPTWNPVLFRGENDRISLFYKMGPSPNDWWGMVIHSIDEGQSWSEPEPLPEGILGPIRNKPLRLKSGTILSPSSTEPTHEIWKSHIERSTDGGLTWTAIDIPSPDSVKVIQPTLLVNSDHRIQALMRSNQNVVMESWSSDEGLTWSEVMPTNIRHPNSGIDAVNLQYGGMLLVNNPMQSGNSWEAGRNKLDLYYSPDGKNWKDIFKLENEPAGEFSYPSIIQTEEGFVHISYTYNRMKIRHVTLRIKQKKD